MAAGISMACWSRPVAAAWAVAACRLARSASSQAAACPGVDSGGAHAAAGPVARSGIEVQLREALAGGQRGVQVVVQQPSGRGIATAGWRRRPVVPCVGLTPIMLYIDLAKSFGKDPMWVLGFILLPFVFFPLLGFGDARYLGPIAHP